MDSLPSFAFDLTALSIPIDASLVEIFCTSPTGKLGSK